MKIIDFESHDGENIQLHLWADIKGTPIGVLQIMHGMSEHMGRYDEFAKFLNGAGIIVVGDDHRAHGKTAGAVEKVGVCGKGDIFDRTVKDQMLITDNFSKLYPDLPYFVLGHAYGAQLLERYLEFKSSAVRGAIFVAAAYVKGSPLRRAASMSRFGDKNAPGDKFYNRLFGKADKDYPNKAWLSSDKVVAKRFTQDPYCMQKFSNGFYRSLFTGIKQTYNKNEMNKIGKDLPMLMLSGDKDPTTRNGELTKKQAEIYKTVLGVKDVSCKIYEDMFHEVLNEYKREEVYDDLIKFMTAIINPNMPSVL